MTEVHIDFETYCDLNIRDVGAARYLRHPSCQVILMAWAVDDGDVQQWEPDEDPEFPKELAEIIEDPATMLWAHNAAFERGVFGSVLRRPVPIRRWRDTMMLARFCSLPATLDAVCNVLGLSPDQAKLRTGRALIKMFCTPRGGNTIKPEELIPGLFADDGKRILPKAKPLQWQEFKDYNIRDVIAEREIHRKLRKYDMPWLWEEYAVSEEINDRGLPINLDMVENAIKIYEEEHARLIRQMKEITGLRNPNSPLALLDWLRARGYPMRSVRKQDITAGIANLTIEMERAQDPRVIQRLRTVIQVLRLRQIVSKSSVKKFYALQRATDPDDLRLRGTLEFYGAARTGRYSGRIFQPQNLPRPPKPLSSVRMQHEVAECVEHLDRDSLDLLFGNVIDVLKGSVRPAVQAPEGYVFCDADLSAIEARGVGWATECEKMLDVFRAKRDIYMAFAADMYQTTYEAVAAEKEAGDKSKRTAGKPGILGAGYGLGPGKVLRDSDGIREATGLLGYAWEMGIDSFTPELSELSVGAYRKTYPEVPEFWRRITKAVMATVRDGKPRRVTKFRIQRNKNFLEIVLPSKRILRYYKPAVQMKETPWGEVRPTFTYMGKDQKTGAWKRIKTHGGKLLENIVQALSRDILVEGILHANREGLDVFLHVHDQIVAMSPEDRAEKDLALLIDCMTRQPKWADGLPLSADGVITRVFVKD